MLNVLKTLFWDVDIKKFKPKKFPKYTIERVLEHGNLVGVRWLEKTFSKRRIYNISKKSRVLSSKSKAVAKIRYGN